MNFSTYIFGKLPGGYSQYPDDGCSTLLRDIYPRCNAPTQLVIHRDQSMMYYVYVRKLDAGRYIGLAVVINGYYFTQINTLFSLFEKKIEELAAHGVVINYSPNGELTTSLQALNKEEEEVIWFINQLRAEIQKINTVGRIPHVDYAVSIDSQKIFDEKDDNSAIAEASYTFGYTIVLKQKDYDTQRSTSYRNTLKQLNADNKALTGEVAKLKEVKKQLLRKKKQFNVVVGLLILVLLCGIWIFSLNKDIDRKQGELTAANDTIRQKDSVIIDKDTTILTLNNYASGLKGERDRLVGEKAFLESVVTDQKTNIQNLESSVSELERKLAKTTKQKDANIQNLENSVSELKRKLAKATEQKGALPPEIIQTIYKYFPFVITSLNVNSRKVEFGYYSKEAKTIKITLSAIKAGTSEVVSNYHTLTLHKGTGTMTLSFASRLNSAQTYYVLLICNRQVIAGKLW